MLETIREYAGERLDASRDLYELQARHATHYRRVAEREDGILRAGEPEEGPVGVLATEIDNLRAAVAFALDEGEPDVIRTITASLPMYWLMRGLYGEGRRWLDRALALDQPEDDTKRHLLSALGTIAYAQGDHVAAIAASDAAADLAGSLGGETERLDLLREQAVAVLRKGELDEAERLFSERLEVAIAVDNGVATSSCRLNLTSIANLTGDHDRAEAFLAENLPFVRARGQARCEAYTLAGLAETAVLADQASARLDDAVLGATRALQIDDRPLAVYCLDLAAVAVAARGEAERAAMILAATEAARESMGVGCDEDEEVVRAHALAKLDRGSDVIRAAWSQGRALQLSRALELARAE